MKIQSAWTVLIGLLLMQMVVAWVPEITIAPWKGDKDGAVSITFDDYYDSWLPQVNPLARRFGFSLTFFVLTNRLSIHGQAVRTLDSLGHEIGSHSITHPHFTLLDSKEVVRQFEESKAAIEQLLGKDCKAFAWPYGQSTADLEVVASRYYRFSRGAYPSNNIPIRGLQFFIEPDTPRNSQYVKALDLTNVRDVNTSNQLVDLAISNKQWFVEMYHDVDTVETDSRTGLDRLEAHMQYLKARDANVWVAPFSKVAEYIEERKRTNIRLLKVSDTLIRIVLEKEPPGALFPVPLTIRYPIAPWSIINSVYRNSTTASVGLKFGKGQYMMILEMSPGVDTLSIRGNNLISAENREFIGLAAKTLLLHPNPNPTTVRFGKTVNPRDVQSIEIYQVNGTKIVALKSGAELGAARHGNLPIDRLPNGGYLLRVKIKSKVFQAPFLVVN